MTVAEMGRMLDKTPLDAWLDLAIDEGLHTMFGTYASKRDEEEYESNVRNPYSHVSLSDGGAHIKYLNLASWPIRVLSHWSRDKQVISLEQAAYKISAYPAWIASMKDRGMLRIGSWADIIVYDLEKLGLLYDRHTYATDFPGGRAPRDPEAHGAALHNSQRHGHLRGQRMHRRPAGQAAP